MRDALGRNQPDQRRRQPDEVSKEQRDNVILALRRRRWTYAQIAKHVGCTKTVVAKTCQRAIRPTPREPGDVDTLGNEPEEW